MKIVTLDVHTELCQLMAVTEHRVASGSSTEVIRPGGEVIIELQVETRPEVSDDERDTRRLSTLARVGAIREVYIPEEPHRTLRSLTHHEYTLAKDITRAKNRLKALCRRHGIRCRGTGVYTAAGRAEVLKMVPNALVKWQMQGMYRRPRDPPAGGEVRLERARARQLVGKCAKKLPAIKRIETAPGMGPTTAPTVVAWIAAQRPAFGWTRSASRAARPSAALCAAAVGSSGA